MRALLKLAPTKLPNKPKAPKIKCHECSMRRTTTATRTNPYDNVKALICIECHANRMTKSRLAKSIENVENQLNNLETLVEKA